MDKNWLIRTKSNHILGPVSKEKVQELYKNGSIKPDDEVCSGNGYWFFIREDEMVERFLTGNEAQGFNPISEAKDVITQTPEVPSVERDDITRVGGLNLSLLTGQSDRVPSQAEIPIPKDRSQTPNPKETPSPEVKKKNNSGLKSKVTPRQTKPLKKQNYLKYVGILGFLFLFLMVYFRKSIIRTFFQGEMTFNLITLVLNDAHAQEVLPEQKKNLLESSITLEKINFKPSVGLDGFSVISLLNIEEINCSDLNNEVYQLGVVLHPPELVNEKFLIKLRDCFLKLEESHPVKKWMKWMSKSKPLNKKELKIQGNLTDIINSQFNLITDFKVKNQIVKILYEIPENTLSEKVLKSYLYLMIGNIARSDNILREFIDTSPIENWKKSRVSESFYHKLSSSLMTQLFTKLSQHPADRRSFELFCLYLQNYYNDESLLTIAGNIDTSAVEAALDLNYTEVLAPSLVKFIRLSRMSENHRMRLLRNFEKVPLSEQSYWIWPFINIDPLVSEALNPELLRLEKEDELWFIYLMDNEKLADFFSKKHGKSFLPSRRPYLKSNLDNPQVFMLSLYKLIELGDINKDLVQKTTEYITHD